MAHVLDQESQSNVNYQTLLTPSDTRWDTLENLAQVSEIDIAGRPGQICPPMMFVDRVLLIQVDLEEPIVYVTFEVLEPK